MHWQINQCREASLWAFAEGRRLLCMSKQETFTVVRKFSYDLGLAGQIPIVSHV
jgi:hypothetical protein